MMSLLFTCAKIKIITKTILGVFRPAYSVTVPIVEYLLLKQMIFHRKNTECCQYQTHKIVKMEIFH